MIRVGKDTRAVGKVYIGRALISKIYHAGRLVYRAGVNLSRILFGPPTDRVFVDSLPAAADRTLTQDQLSPVEHIEVLQDNYQLAGTAVTRTDVASGFTRPSGFFAIGPGVEDNSVLLASRTAIKKNMNGVTTDVITLGTPLTSDPIGGFETSGRIYLATSGDIFCYNKNSGVQTNSRTYSLPAGANFLGLDSFADRKIGLVHSKGILVYNTRFDRDSASDIVRDYGSDAKRAGGGFIFKNVGGFQLVDYNNRPIVSPDQSEGGTIGGATNLAISKDGTNFIGLDGRFWRRYVIQYSGTSERVRVDIFKDRRLTPRGFWVQSDNTVVGYTSEVSSDNSKVKYRFFEADISKLVPTVEFIDNGGYEGNNPSEFVVFTNMVKTKNYIYGSVNNGTVVKIDRKARSFDMQTNFMPAGGILFRMENVLAVIKDKDGVPTVHAYGPDLSRLDKLDFAYKTPRGVPTTFDKLDAYARGYFFIEQGGRYTIFRHDYDMDGALGSPQRFIANVNNLAVDRDAQPANPVIDENVIKFYNRSAAGALERRSITTPSPLEFGIPFTQPGTPLITLAEYQAAVGTTSRSAGYLLYAGSQGIIVGSQFRPSQPAFFISPDKTTSTRFGGSPFNVHTLSGVANGKVWIAGTSFASGRGVAQLHTYSLDDITQRSEDTGFEIPDVSGYTKHTAATAVHNNRIYVFYYKSNRRELMFRVWDLNFERKELEDFTVLLPEGSTWSRNPQFIGSHVFVGASRGRTHAYPIGESSSQPQLTITDRMPSGALLGYNAQGSLTYSTIGSTTRLFIPADAEVRPPITDISFLNEVNRTYSDAIITKNQMISGTRINLDPVGVGLGDYILSAGYDQITRKIGLFKLNRDHTYELLYTAQPTVAERLSFLRAAYETEDKYYLFGVNANSKGELWTIDKADTTNVTKTESSTSTCRGLELFGERISQHAYTKLIMFNKDGSRAESDDITLDRSRYPFQSSISTGGLYWVGNQAPTNVKNWLGDISDVIPSFNYGFRSTFKPFLINRALNRVYNNRGIYMDINNPRENLPEFPSFSRVSSFSVSAPTAVPSTGLSLDVNGTSYNADFIFRRGPDIQTNGVANTAGTYLMSYTIGGKTAVGVLSGLDGTPTLTKIAEFDTPTGYGNPSAMIEDDTHLYAYRRGSGAPSQILKINKSDNTDIVIRNIDRRETVRGMTLYDDYIGITGQSAAGLRVRMFNKSDMTRAADKDIINPLPNFSSYSSYNGIGVGPGTIYRGNSVSIPRIGTNSFQTPKGATKGVTQVLARNNAGTALNRYDITYVSPPAYPTARTFSSVSIEKSTDTLSSTVFNITLTDKNSNNSTVSASPIGPAASGKDILIAGNRTVSSTDKPFAIVKFAEDKTKTTICSWNNGDNRFGSIQAAYETATKVYVFGAGTDPQDNRRKVALRIFNKADNTIDSTTYTQTVSSFSRDGVIETGNLIGNCNYSRGRIYMFDKATGARRRSMDIIDPPGWVRENEIQGATTVTAGGLVFSTRNQSPGNIMQIGALDSTEPAAEVVFEGVTRGISHRSMISADQSIMYVGGPFGGWTKWNLTWTT